MASTYYIYAFVGLPWCSLINMNSIHVETITYKELAYIFCESSTCLQYKLENSGLCSKVVFWLICITFVGIGHIYIYGLNVCAARAVYIRFNPCAARAVYIRFNPCAARAVNIRFNPCAARAVYVRFNPCADGPYIYGLALVLMDRIYTV